LALKTVREEMIRLKWSMSYINRQILRIKSVFRWAAENELVPASVYESLRTVAGLRAGKSDARETAPVKPVDQSHAEAIFDFLPSPVQALVLLQALTGARPGELLIMRTCDIDTTGTPWKFRPASHKNAHRGHERIIELGPQAREIVAKFLKPDLQAYLFTPSEAEAERRQQRHEQRKTAMTCGNVPGSKRRRRPRYDPTTYRRTIMRACERAFPPPDDLARLRVAVTGGRRRNPSDGRRARSGGSGWARSVGKGSSPGSGRTPFILTGSGTALERSSARSSAWRRPRWCSATRRLLRPKFTLSKTRSSRPRSRRRSDKLRIPPHTAESMRHRSTAASLLALLRAFFKDNPTWK
jgi:hypothetical protein